MEIMLTKRVLPLLFILYAVTLGSIEAHAGSKYFLVLQITNNYIVGTLGSARNSSKSLEYLTISDRGHSMQVIARNARGTRKTCATNKPTHMAALRGATSDAYIYARFSGGVCTNVRIINGSGYEPKAP